MQNNSNPILEQIGADMYSATARLLQYIAENLMGTEVTFYGSDEDRLSYMNGITKSSILDINIELKIREDADGSLQYNYYIFIYRVDTPKSFETRIYFSQNDELYKLLPQTIIDTLNLLHGKDELLTIKL